MKEELVKLLNKSRSDFFNFITDGENNLIYIR